MPGIVTHSRAFKESIHLLARKEKRSYLLNSIGALFSDSMHLTAGLFGSIGPNIFDYIPFRSRKDIFGSGSSFFIHNGGADQFINSMIRTIYSYEDKNNEWASAQRSYLYGLISHVVTDAYFHPFIFYFSGFPSAYTRKEIRFFRIQNLLFQYNLDNYFQYHDDKITDFSFTIDEMLPISRRGKKTGIYPAIKELILNTLKETYPDIYEKIMIFDCSKIHSSMTNRLSYLDLMPLLIRTAYAIKRSDNRRLANACRSLIRNGTLYSDFFVCYPLNRRYNKNVLNLHRQRWENPAGKIGLHYESVQNLMAQSCEKTVELWEKIESSLYGRENHAVFDDLTLNAYTGASDLAYDNMKLKEPIRLSI